MNEFSHCNTYLQKEGTYTIYIVYIVISDASLKHIISSRLPSIVTRI